MKIVGRLSAFAGLLRKRAGWRAYAILARLKNEANEEERSCIHSIYEERPPE